MTRLARLVLPACALLAACGGSRDAPAPPPSQTSAGPAPPAASGRAAEGTAITAAAGLVGEYRVAGVDGGDIDLPYGITAAIDGERIRVTADCATLTWRYRFEGERLVTEREAVVGCARSLGPTEQALLAALDVAHAVRRTPANALEIAGAGHAVTLFGQ